mgnify:CR=1 FL=1
MKKILAEDPDHADALNALGEAEMRGLPSMFAGEHQQQRLLLPSGHRRDILDRSSNPGRHAMAGRRAAPRGWCTIREA